MAQIQLENVTNRWGNLIGVDNFNLDIADAEFLVLLGPSGCGKTTTMRMIAGLEELTEGEIWIGDRMVNKLEPKDRDISMVFQSYGLYPNLTVYENIRFPLRVRKVPQASSTRAGDARRRHGGARPAFWTAGPPPCPAASASAWRWRAPSSANPMPS